MKGNRLRWMGVLNRNNATMIKQKSGMGNLIGEGFWEDPDYDVLTRLESA